MRHELDTLLRSRNLDAMMVSGKTLGNPSLIYLLNGARVTQAIIIKKVGESGVLIASPIEREEATASGLRVILNSRYDYRDCLRLSHGDPLTAAQLYYERIFDDLGILGRVGLYGNLDQGYAYALMTALDKAFPHITFVGEINYDVVTEARATKDPGEAARIREVGTRTKIIVNQTLQYLQSHRTGHNEILRKSDGTDLTIGDVHNHITRMIGMQNLADPEGFIFSTGSDAGIPHSRGTKSKPIRLGETIVFDIFPCEPGGGYFFDLTRTFCLGYAPPDVKKLYADVLDCLHHIQSTLQCGRLASDYQKAACAFFKSRKHKTIDQYPTTQEGYVHGLGHGVGLAIHESPGFEDTPANQLRIAPGHIFTIEPGLYYPTLGMGCRLEDVMWVDEAGEIQNLTEYPYDLIVPIDNV